MKKIINFTFIICVLCLIVINIYRTPKDLVILVKKGTDITDTLSLFSSEYSASVSIEYYDEDSELFNLLKNGNYDFVIAKENQNELLFKNKLINSIDKKDVPNYRNIEDEYVNDSNLYIPLYKENSNLYVMYITSNNKKAISLMDYLLKADITAEIVKNNNFENINWASARFYL